MANLIVKTFKNYLRIFIPTSILEKRKQSWLIKKQNERIKNNWKIYIDHYKYEYNRYLQYSNSLWRNDTESKLTAQIVSIYHSIEKGLTLGNLKLGFGEEKIKLLLSLCKMFIEYHGAKNELLIEAVSVLSEYDRIHKKANFLLNENIQEEINSIIAKVPDARIAEQLKFTKEEYFKDSDSNFLKFSASRFSLRDFKENESIELKVIEKSIELAQRAPSTCNRQSVRIHVVANKNLLLNVLKLQNGNRGFGDRADKGLIVTVDLQSWEGPSQQNGPYMDAGIYTMNLLYALHYYKVGACALNWYVPNENDIALRKIIQIPENEVIAVIIACGNLKDEFKIALSKRRSAKSILTIHN